MSPLLTRGVSGPGIAQNQIIYQQFKLDLDNVISTICTSTYTLQLAPDAICAVRLSPEVSSDCSVVTPAGGGVGAASPGPRSTPRGLTEPQT